jgi:quinoprotein glucose dehydrogenase
MPGTMGGGNWGGVSFDPQNGYIFVNTSSLGGTGLLVRANPDAPMAWRNEGGYQRFIDPEGFPCQQPPWGELTAVNGDGDIAWRVPLGSYDEMEAKGLKNAGAANMGGSIATGGGLVFIGATTDSKFRAFDSHTGAELWVTRLEATADTVPITYQGRNGKQYVVIAAGGTNRFRMLAGTADQSSDSLIAFALPDGSGTPVGAPTEATRPTVPTRLSEADLKADAAPLPEGSGKEAVVQMCTKCHGTAVFTRIRMGRKGWEDEVASMVERGAVGTEQQVRAVVEYLARNFGK